MELIEINGQEITVIKGQIFFANAEDILKSAKKLNEYLKKVIVTDDNLKESKKLIASVRKEIDKLDKQRVIVKKEMLKPYNELEIKIKEIIETVQQGESIIREQTKKLEEKERRIKYEQLRLIFDKRLKKYEVLKKLNIQFNDFIQPHHLNKTMSIEKVELAMVEWFEKMKQDIEVMETMKNGHEMILEYEIVRNLAKAISIVNDRHNKIDEKKQQLSNGTEKTEYTLIVYHLKDKQTILKFAKQNNIDIKENK
ncbi:DUF1351 domain-containing protein [Carnobacteriaceae bacterium zg-ZUI78]|nr:DUF1351 domain-containing protein [Carnobacteriaceae bacterium zg-ZUI78]